MLPVVCPVACPVTWPSAPVCADPGFAHDEAYADYFARVAETAAPAAALQRLALHLDADLDADDRLALWRSLWRVWQRADGAARAIAQAALDGRHAAALSALDLDWADTRLLLHLCEHTPAAARPAFVPLLLAQQGIEALTGDQAPPALVMHAARAAVAGDTRLDADTIDRLQAAMLAAATRDPALLPQGLALLFELALHAHDEAGATAALAECLGQGHAALLRPERLCAWLDGSAFADDASAATPLRLAPPLQRRWLLPARWAERGWLAALHAALRRQAPRARLQALAAALPPRADGPPPDAEALQGLARLDQAWALAAAGRDPLPPLAGRLHKSVLAPPAIAAVQRERARVAARTGDLETEVLALNQARRHGATPALREALARLLPLPAPPLTPDWRSELPLWQQLLQHADPMWQRIAARQLAMLWTDGLLEPRPPRRCAIDPQAARPLWQRLATHPLHAGAAAAALRQGEQVLMHDAWRQRGDEAWLWFETPGAQQVLVVFSCVATHHGFAEVAALQGRMPGHHLLFLRCPALDWYSDDSFERARALLREQVAQRFPRHAVSCWYGSMGGHGAWKFALEFGWRAIVFNAQTDLDLWAAFRPRERALLWGARRHARLSDWPLDAWEQVPLYLACGAASADRAALSVAIERLRHCRRLDAIVEKFDDADHAGLMNRITGGAVAPALQRIDQRLQAMAAATPAAGPGIDGAALADFWRRLDAARALKLEIQVRDGRLWWQPSLATGTR